MKPRVANEDSIIEEAADWISRLQSGRMTPENEAALKAWLDQSVRHLRVFHRMSGVLARSEVLRVEARLTPSRASASGGRIGKHRRPLLAAATLMALVAATLPFVWAPVETHETATGERSSVFLDDGSTIDMNAATRIEVRYSGSGRRVVLSRGEAVFDVAPDPQRPFVVQAGALSLTVLGTTFNVYAGMRGTEVTVLEGEVGVADLPMGQPVEYPGRSLLLRENEQVRLQEGWLTEPLKVDAGRVAAWREGWLYAESRPLVDIIDRLNRQFEGHIAIADPALARLRVNVVLQVDDRTSTLVRLQQLLPIEVVELPEERAVIHARD